MTEPTRPHFFRAVIAVLSLIIAAIAYKFIFSGSVRRGDDSRLVIVFDPGERAPVPRIHCGPAVEPSPPGSAISPSRSPEG